MKLNMFFSTDRSSRSTLKIIKKNYILIIKLVVDLSRNKVALRERDADR